MQSYSSITILFIKLFAMVRDNKDSSFREFGYIVGYSVFSLDQGKYNKILTVVNCIR